MISPGSTTGLSALASSLMLSTLTPRSCATLFRLKSLVTILPLKRAGQLDQLEVDLAHFGKVHVGDDHLGARHLLDLLQDVEAATAAVALHRVGRVGHQLQLLEHELRNDQGAVHEPGVADVGDPAVDDHRGVEDLVVTLRSRPSGTGSSAAPARAIRPCGRRPPGPGTGAGAGRSCGGTPRAGRRGPPRRAPRRCPWRAPGPPHRRAARRTCGRPRCGAAATRRPPPAMASPRPKARLMTRLRTDRSQQERRVRHRPDK